MRIVASPPAMKTVASSIMQTSLAIPGALGRYQDCWWLISQKWVKQRQTSNLYTSILNLGCKKIRIKIYLVGGYHSHRIQWWPDPKKNSTHLNKCSFGLWWKRPTHYERDSVLYNYKLLKGKRWSLISKVDPSNPLKIPSAVIKHGNIFQAAIKKTKP